MPPRISNLAKSFRIIPSNLTFDPYLAVSWLFFDPRIFWFFVPPACHLLFSSHTQTNPFPAQIIVLSKSDIPISSRPLSLLLFSSRPPADFYVTFFVSAQ